MSLQNCDKEEISETLFQSEKEIKNWKLKPKQRMYKSGIFGVA